MKLRHIAVAGWACVLILALGWVLVRAQSRPEAAIRTELVEYRMTQLEQQVTRLQAEHALISKLLIANLTAIVLSLAMYILTERRKLRTPGS